LAAKARAITPSGFKATIIRAKKIQRFALLSRIVCAIENKDRVLCINAALIILS